MRRIYDAAFETDSGTHHEHLGTFWWIDDDGSQGSWTRREAYNYVDAYPTGTVYVKEGAARVVVKAYYYIDNPDIRWIQTEADGIKKDNLTTLAERHRAGLTNN